MSCEEMEMLLARYASGELTEDEEFIVDVHLSVCEKCRESLEIYEMLESELLSRPRELPSCRAASRRVMKRLRSEEPEAFMHSIWTAPAIVGVVVALSVILTVIFGLINGGSTAGSREIPGMPGIDRYFTVIPDWISGFFGGEIWLLLAVYGLMATGFVAMGGFLALRYVRD